MVSMTSVPVLCRSGGREAKKRRCGAAKKKKEGGSNKHLTVPLFCMYLFIGVLKSTRAHIKQGERTRVEIEGTIYEVKQNRQHN